MNQFSSVFCLLEICLLGDVGERESRGVRGRREGGRRGGKERERRKKGRKEGREGVRGRGGRRGKGRSEEKGKGEKEGSSIVLKHGGIHTMCTSKRYMYLYLKACLACNTQHRAGQAT